MSRKLWMSFLLMFGVVLPLALTILDLMVPGFKGVWSFLPYWADDLVVAFWPGLIFLMASTGESYATILLIAIAVNAAVYAALGALVWYGVHRSRTILIITVCLVLWYWIWLFL